MPLDEGFSVKELSELLDVSDSSIRRWIKKGDLKAIKKFGKLTIPREGNEIFISKKFRASRSKLHTTYVSSEIAGYNEWHQLIDEISWLIKSTYATREILKRKSFRIDNLFIEYLKAHNLDLKKLRRIFLETNHLNPKLIRDDLKRGWYNELSFIFPLKDSTLGISFNDIDINKDVTNKRFIFPSWKITSAYYSVYFYLRAVTLQKQPTIRIQEHGSTLSAFKYNLLPKLEKVIWKFPLSISWSPKDRVYRRHLLISKIDHLKYQYARHPRPPHSTPIELFENVYGSFRTKGKAKGINFKYTLFDLLHDFRIWANYLDIDNLLSLWGGGYKGFLDQNISLLLFFIGGISELCFISVFGEKKYIDNLQRLYELFALNNLEVEENFINSAPYQRLIIYNKMGIISNGLSFKREFNINAVIV
ncbi:MAG: helix-turn-helix domain-containing protein [Candidatus Thiodiazotropha sp. 'RUGA']|nr:helix-turn-helix domain-containing protein [Candidatus Thiodiazotropha sp. 'RUGA']